MFNKIVHDNEVVHGEKAGEDLLVLYEKKKDFCMEFLAEFFFSHFASLSCVSA